MPLGYPTANEAARVSPTRATWVPQDHHEPILLEYLRTLPSAVTRFDCQLVDLRQTEVGVQALLEDRRSGAVDALHAQYVIAADGARSTVRRVSLGLSLIGPDDLAEFHRVEFVAPLDAIVGRSSVRPVRDYRPLRGRASSLRADLAIGGVCRANGTRASRASRSIPKASSSP